MAPPIKRSDQRQDLDPVGLLHVIWDIPMIVYYTRTIMQYQFAEALCREAGHVGPLHRCDFYNSTAAGTALAYDLKEGKGVSLIDV